MSARFYEQDVKARLADKRKLSAYLDALIIKHRNIDVIHLTYIFCSDEHLHHMNEQFLQHDTLTDILTFDLSAKENEMTGEIYISTDRVEENAKKYNALYIHELHRVIFHGALHLCGFKDKTKQEKEEMRRQEDKCLEVYFKD